MNKFLIILALIILNSMNVAQAQVPCNPRCANGGTCRTVDGTCTCRTGFFGTSCTSRVNYCNQDNDGNAIASPCTDLVLGNCIPITVSNLNSQPGVLCVANNAGGRCLSAPSGSRTGPFALQCQATV